MEKNCKKYNHPATVPQLQNAGPTVPRDGRAAPGRFHKSKTRGATIPRGQNAAPRLERFYYAFAAVEHCCKHYLALFITIH